MDAKSTTGKPITAHDVAVVRDVFEQLIALAEEEGDPTLGQIIRRHIP